MCPPPWRREGRATKHPGQTRTTTSFAASARCWSTTSAASTGRVMRTARRSAAHAPARGKRMGTAAMHSRPRLAPRRAGAPVRRQTRFASAMARWLRLSRSRRRSQSRRCLPTAPGAPATRRSTTARLTVATRPRRSAKGRAANRRPRRGVLRALSPGPRRLRHRRRARTTSLGSSEATAFIAAARWLTTATTKASPQPAAKPVRPSRPGVPRTASR